MNYNLTLFSVKIQIISNKYQCCQNHNDLFIFGTKIQIHHFIISLKIEFVNTISDFLTAYNIGLDKFISFHLFLLQSLDELKTTLAPIFKELLAEEVSFTFIK